MRRWLGRQFGTPWVRVLALCFVVFLAGMVVQSFVDAKRDSACAYCEKPLGGDVFSYHKVCFRAAQDAAFVERQQLAKAQQFMRPPSYRGMLDGSSNRGKPIDVVVR